MRVLVTGHHGYIGSVVASVLRHARFDVVGLDADLYDRCDFGRMRNAIDGFKLDLRDIEFTDLLSLDAVVHLAALPEDASSELNPTLVREINEEAAIRLAACCKKAGVSRFLYSSSFKVYGEDDGTPFTEECQPRPTTPDGVSKLRCEQALEQLANESFTPVLLRHAEVCGVSSRLRVDLMVNEFVASAVTTGRVRVPGAGRSWLPVLHVEDLARACAAVLAAPDELVRGQIFNVIAPRGNHRVIDIADAVTELVPECSRHTAEDLFADRGCRLDGSKLTQTFPEVSFRWPLAESIRQLGTAMSSTGLTASDLRGDRFRRSPRLRSMVEREVVDHTLRRPESIPARQ